MNKSKCVFGDFPHGICQKDYDFLDGKRWKGIKLLPQDPSGPLGDVTIGCYIIVTTGLFKQPDELGIGELESMRRKLALEMRGLVFDREGVCIRRMFHKFFNLGEFGVTVDSIDWSTVDILEKIDGSLIGPFIFDGKIR
jgi:hypothetical protein